jgi:hypothetical protein
VLRHSIACPAMARDSVRAPVIPNFMLSSSMVVASSRAGVQEPGLWRPRRGLAIHLDAHLCGEHHEGFAIGLTHCCYQIACSHWCLTL